MKCTMRLAYCQHYAMSTPMWKVGIKSLVPIFWTQARSFHIKATQIVKNSFVWLIDTQVLVMSQKARYLMAHTGMGSTDVDGEGSSDSNKFKVGYSHIDGVSEL